MALAMCMAVACGGPDTLPGAAIDCPVAILTNDMTARSSS